MRIAASLLALLVLLAGVAPAAALGTAGDDAGPTRDRASLATIEEPSLTVIHLAPNPSGDAEWRISVRYNLSDDADRAAFDRYGRAFEAGDADAGLDVDFFRTLASEASESTGREMRIRGVDRNATLHNGTGTLTLSFTWTNFVTDTPNGFEIQDAVLMPDGRTWLASLGPSQRLVVETPPGYQVTDTRFGLTNGSVVIDGPHTFREPLSISYQQTSVEEPPDSAPWPLIGGAVLLGIGLLAAVIYVRRRGEGATETPESGGDAGATTAETPTEGEGSGEAGAGESAPAPAPDAESAADEQPSETAETGGEPAVDPTLLSDEERVEYLLEQNGGRMRQGQIVRETGWSDAKVSQLLSTMADEGRVEKLRLGRENLISLPEEEPGP